MNSRKARDWSHTESRPTQQTAVRLRDAAHSRHVSLCMWGPAHFSRSLAYHARREEGEAMETVNSKFKR